MVNVPVVYNSFIGKPIQSELVRSTEPFDLISFVYRTPLIRHTKKTNEKNKKLKIITLEKMHRRLAGVGARLLHTQRKTQRNVI